MPPDRPPAPVQVPDPVLASSSERGLPVAARLRPSRRALLSAAAVGGAGLVLSGCGGTRAAVLEAGDTPQAGGTCAWGSRAAAPPTPCDAHVPLGTGDAARVFSLYDTLFAYDPEYRLVPSLAVSAEPNEAGDEWTVRLRPGVTFHDGRALTADDVRSTFERILDPEDPKAGVRKLGTVQRVEAVDELTVRFDDEDALVNSLLSSQVDVVAQVPLALVQVISEDPRIEVISSETGSWLPFTMRTDVAPFDDPRVREAFKLVVDREQMVEVAFSGQGRVADDMDSPFDPGCPAQLPQRERDAQRARELLREAGHGGGLRVELVTAPIQAGAVESATVFAEQAADAGIEVSLRRVDATTFFDVADAYQRYVGGGAPDRSGMPVGSFRFRNLWIATGEQQPVRSSAPSSTPPSTPTSTEG